MAEPSPQEGWLPIVLCPTDGMDRALLLPDGAEVVGAFHNEGFGGRNGWVTAEPVEYDAPVYDTTIRGGLLSMDIKPWPPEVERTQVGTRKAVMWVHGKLAEGVFPTHFRPNDTVYGDARAPRKE